MGRIARMLSFVRVVRNNANVTDVKADPGGGPNITAEHFSGAGDDSHPRPGDYVALGTDSGEGREMASGYIDPINKPKALIGEKRVYARDDNGVSIVEMWFKNTGEVTIENQNGTIVLRPDGSIKAHNEKGFFELAQEGDFLVNGVTIDTGGNITSPSTISSPNVIGSVSVKASGKELVEHSHPAGTPPGNTGANN